MEDILAYAVMITALLFAVGVWMWRGGLKDDNGKNGNK